MFPIHKLPHVSHLHSGITWFNPQAGPMFERALWLGNFHRSIRRLLRRSSHLLVLSEYASPDMIYQAQPGLLQAVSLDAIRGTVSRTDEFDGRFRPLDQRLKTRWVRVASMMLQQTALPPVELIRVGGIYFVVDGHHRISVAQALRLHIIDAIITGSYE